MYLQPKYDPKADRITGAEALVRWQTQDRGMLYPDQYIPLFESNGFIVRIDWYIFEEDCRFIQEQIRAGIEPIPISVNLSRAHLNNPNFIEDFVSVWSKYRFNPRLLDFEVTENLIFDNMKFFHQTIASLHRFGFLVSMDDFGSGYSSLNMLKSVDVDAVKLDRQFFLSSD